MEVGRGQSPSRMAVVEGVPHPPSLSGLPATLSLPRREPRGARYKSERLGDEELSHEQAGPWAHGSSTAPCNGLEQQWP